MITAFRFFEAHLLSRRIVFVASFGLALLTLMLFTPVLHGQSFVPIDTLTGVEKAAAAWGDFDNDKDLDLLLTGGAAEGNIAKIYKNNNGKFKEHAALAEVQGGSVAWGDFDNDGDLDILLTGAQTTDNITKIYKNDDGSFTEVSTSLPAISSSAGVWGDYDNDGDLDILLAGDVKDQDAHLAKIFRNERGVFKDINATALIGVENASAAWGDYDNDGDLDIVLAGLAGDDNPTAKVYRNNAGTFEDSKVVLPGVGTNNEVAVAWGDYDNDGRLDILLAGEGVNAKRIAKVYHNEAETFRDIGAGLDGINDATAAWGDFNNDGRLDIILAGKDSTSKRIAKIYRNEGGNRFTDIKTLLIGTSRGSIVCGDYDNDQDLDILISGDIDIADIAYIYRNDVIVKNTAPTFPTNLASLVEGNKVTLRWEKAADNETGQNGLTYNLRVGNALGAGKIVAPMANFATGDRQVPQLGNADLNTSWSIQSLPKGTYFWSVQAIDHGYEGSAFAPEQSFTIAKPLAPRNFVALTGDQQVTLRWDRSNEPGLLRYRIYGGTSPNPATVIDSTSSSDTTKTLTGLNRRATYYFRLALVDGSFNRSDFSNEVTATPALFSKIETSLPGVQNSSVAWGDYNNDNQLDILLTGAGTAQIYRNDGRGTFVNSAAALVPVDGSAAGWGDYDSDGDLDVLLTGSGFGRVYRNDGKAFRDIKAILPGIENGEVAWGDYDNDGDLDFLLTGTDRATGADLTQLYRNDDGIFKDAKASLPEIKNGSVAWGDYDNDGDPDILLMGISLERLPNVYRNDVGTFRRAFTSNSSNPFLQNLADGSAAWGDYDNDGDLDILLTGSGAAKVYRNDNKKFVDASALLSGVSNSSAVWGDYDNDGDLDILLTGKTDSGPVATIYRNNGNRFEDINPPLASVDHSAVAWGDYDNDGDLDILLTGQSRSGPITAIYRNESAAANKTPAPPTSLSAKVTGRSVKLSWSPATDPETPPKALTYNIRIGFTASSAEIVAPMSDLDTGYRQIPQFGGMNHNTSWSWTFKQLPQGTYFWSVQALDHAFAGSAFSAAQSFEIKPLLPPQNLSAIASNQEITLRWNRYTAGGILGYRIYMDPRPNPTTLVDSTKSITDTTKTLTKLTNGELYYFRITALDSTRSESDFSNEVSATPTLFTDIGAPLTPVRSGTVAWGDYDNDNDLDILVTGDKADTPIRSATVYKNIGGRFVNINAALVGVDDGGATWGDYDNDGDLDILLIGEALVDVKEEDVTKVYRNDGNDRFVDIKADTLLGVENGAAIWGDYDNDGDLDILLAGHTVIDNVEIGVTRLYNNAGQDRFLPIKTSFPDLDNAAIAWGDYDNDGDLDVFLSGRDNDEVYLSRIYKNDGGNFNIAATLAKLRDGSAAWGDYDNDGDLDLLLTGNLDGKATFTEIYRNDGGSSFTPIGAKLQGVRESKAVWGDLDNDGDLDILLSGNAGIISPNNQIPTTRIYQNNGGRFDSLNVSLNHARGGGAAWGDYDLDGDLDILLTGETGNRIAKVYRNNFTAARNTAPNTPTNLVSAISGNTVTLSWDKATDRETAANALTYNLRVGKTPGGSEIFAPMSDPANGYFRLGQSGNTGLSNRWTIKNLKPGTTYYWSVQAIDNSFAGSAFGPERVFRLGGAALVSSQTSLDFGDLTVQSRGKLFFRCTNAGSTKLTVQRVSVTGNDASAFIYTEPQNFSLEPGSSLQLSVQFAPTATGAKTAALRLEHDAANIPTTVTLNGNGVAGNVPFLEVRTLALDFDSVFVSDQTKTDTVHVINSGSAVLNVTDIEITGADKENFSVIANLPITVPAGNRTMILVLFRPTLLKSNSRFEEKTARLVIRHGTGTNPRAVDLRGNVVGTTINLNLTTLNFDDTNVGNTTERTLTITNNGLTALRLASLRISGRDQAQFSVNGQADITIGRNLSEGVTIKFSPQSLEPKQAVLQINIDLPTELPRFIALSGKGVDTEKPKIQEVAANKPIIALDDTLIVSAKITDNTHVANVRLEYRPAGLRKGNESGSTLMDPVAAGNARYQARLAVTSARGLEYRIVASDDFRRDSLLAWQPVQVRLPDKELTQTQQGGIDRVAYRMISMPLILDNPSARLALRDDLGDPDIKKWRLAEINPAGNPFYRELHDVGDFNFIPGKGYFLITNETKTLTSGPGVTAKPLDDFPITLQTGWNIISSPFNFKIPIDNIRPSPDSLKENLYAYDVGYKTAPAELAPWEGYMIKAQAPFTISIHPAAEIERPATTAKPAAAPIWSISIEAFCQQARDVINRIGIAPDAAIEWDRHDRFEPPPIGEFVTVVFPHWDWKKYPDIYTTDFRPPSEEGHVWEFTVNTNLPGQPVTLRFENLETVPENFEVHLLDLSLELLQNLREERQYVFASSRNAETKKFQLLAGTSAFIQQHSAEALGIPTTYQVSQNFPNPFNPSTTIRYGLPQAGRVMLKIYNLLGEEVVTLLDNVEKKAGYHVAIWDGRNRNGRLASSGVYIFRLRAGTFVVTKKMAMVK